MEVQVNNALEREKAFASSLVNSFCPQGAVFARTAFSGPIGRFHPTCIIQLFLVTFYNIVCPQLDCEYLEVFL